MSPRSSALPENFLTDRGVYQARYEEIAGHEDHRNPHRYMEVMQFFRPEPGQTILELGSGTGGNILFYSQCRYEITGVEVAQRFIDTTRRVLACRPPHQQLRVRLVHSFIEDFEPDREWDWVLLTEVLEHVQDPIPVLAKARECVKDSGQVYITAPAERVGGWEHVRGVPPLDLTCWLNLVDMKVREIFTVPNKLYNPEFQRTICFAERA